MGRLFFVLRVVQCEVWGKKGDTTTACGLIGFRHEKASALAARVQPHRKIWHSRKTGRIAEVIHAPEYFLGLLLYLAGKKRNQTIVQKSSSASAMSTSPFVRSMKTKLILI